MSSEGEVLADNHVSQTAKQSNLWDSARSCSAMIWSELESDRILREQTDILLRKELKGVADRSIITDVDDSYRYTDTTYIKQRKMQ